MRNMYEVQSKDSLFLAYGAISEFLKQINQPDFEKILFEEICKFNTPWFNSSGEEYYYYCYKQYLEDSVIPHKVSVYEEGMRLQSYVSGVVHKHYWKDQLIRHDLSKFSHAEQGYAWKFFGDKFYSGKQPESIAKMAEKSFQEGWFHHKAHNPHHPEWWHSVERDGKTTKCYPMEQHYALEMLADWAGASRTYGNDLFEWMNNNLSKFKIHDDSLRHLVKPLVEVYGILLDISSREVTKVSLPVDQS